MYPSLELALTCRFSYFQMLSLGSELKVLMQCGGHLNLVNLLGIVAENIANRKNTDTNQISIENYYFSSLC